MKAKRRGRIYIGTSGWMYKDWGAMFYPRGMKKGFLTYLAAEFNTVEVNSSFYHLPLASTFTKWKSEVPDNFVFAVKLSRYITHQKKLASVGRELNTFLARARKLSTKLGAILVQLPPFLKYDEKLLSNFVKLLRNKRERFALEPRHATWFVPETLTLLKKSKVALVFPHSAKIPSPDPDDAKNITADFVYVRFHGPSEFAASRYGAVRLKPWAERIKQWQTKGLDIFVYFNNDIHGHAIIDARTLKKLIGNQ
jgi:uncharacterized protein YecE (DUF72 family)